MQDTPREYIVSASLKTKQSKTKQKLPTQAKIDILHDNS